jgi:hypothetical protein
VSALSDRYSADDIAVMARLLEGARKRREDRERAEQAAEAAPEPDQPEKPA